jgi:spectinomycin phosphotransferase
METYEALAARAALSPEEYVVTHGEPHGGNLCDTGAGLRLVDWDTVALAAPERDLWMLGDDVGNAERLALYRMRWRLDDVASYTAQLRSPHAGTVDDELALRYLGGYLAEA